MSKVKAEVKQIQSNSSEKTAYTLSSKFLPEIDEQRKPAPSKLHEYVSKKFNNTDKGKIVTNDLKEIFSTLIICLDLKQEPDVEKEKPTFKLFQGKRYPFSFRVEEAISKMSSLKLCVDQPATRTTISYSVKPSLTKVLLEKFMRAKLLHCPAERTRSDPKEGVQLQPTAKGCAVIQMFCFKIGLKGKELPDILYSNFNSMDLVCFERHPVQDTIIYSDYLIYLLFVKFLGPKPNIWSLINKPDPIPHSSTKLSVSLAGISFDLAQGFHPDRSLTTVIESDLVSNLAPQRSARTSPFHHKYFTNPDSDSLVQYYVSDKGVRLNKNLTFGQNRLNLGFTFTGKSALQWFMDCSDIFEPHEATKFLSLFVLQNLIEPVLLVPSTSPKTGFKAGNKDFYTLTQQGLQSAHWNTGKGNKMNVDGEEAAELKLEDLTLEDVLQDPGCKYLFRKHLEQDMCMENLDLYLEIDIFKRQMRFLDKLIAYRDENNDTRLQKARNKATAKFVNECLSKVFSIHSSYLSYGAPYGANISDTWKRQAEDILIFAELQWKESIPTTPTTPLNNFDTVVKETLEKSVEEHSRSKNVHYNYSQVSDALKVLKAIEPLFSKISRHMYFLLSQDSLPKFVNSPLFQEESPRVKLSKSQNIK